MNKAFIFDMDGVIINSESMWNNRVAEFYSDLFGTKIYKKIKDEWMGSTINQIYDLAVKNGFTMKKNEFMDRYDKQALYIYSISTPTNDINKLLLKLSDLDFKIGIVTGSRPIWIETVLKKIKNRNLFSYIISLAERQDLKPKPSPDGFIEAIQKLGSTPEKAIILEDSNKGLKAAMASGAFTICLREHLPQNHISEKANMTINNLQSLITFLDELKM